VLRKILFYFLILFFTATLFTKNNTYAADSCTQVLSSPSPLIVGEQHFNIQVRFDEDRPSVVFLPKTKFTPGDYFITIGGNSSPYNDGATKQRPANAALLENGSVSTIEEFNLSDGFRWGIDKKLQYGTLNVYVWKKNPDQLICEGSVKVTNIVAKSATTKSCPLCQSGYSWSYTYDLCQKGTNYQQPASRIDCSAQGTVCVAGAGYCSNPSPPKACSSYVGLNSNCNPAKTNPGDCANDLVCDSAKKKCVKATTSLGPTCYKCLAENIWNGEYCADANNNTCVAPESRVYCENGFSCTQGKGCLKSTDNSQDKDKKKLNPLNAPCGTSLTGDDSNANTKDGECLSIFSALGDIPTDPFDLVPRIIEIILGLAGAIVIILIIRSGYKLMFSQGNPEKVQEAKDELTSAIVGLLFIIFSFVLLQFITNDILNLEILKKGEGIKTP